MNRKLIVVIEVVVLLALIAGALAAGYFYVGSMVVQIQEQEEKAGKAAETETEETWDGDVFDRKHDPEEEKTVRTVVCLTGSKGKSIRGIILCVHEKEKGKMTLMTVPADTRFSMSRGLYRYLSSSARAVPQVVTADAIYGYFNDDGAFEAAVLMMNDLTGTEFCHYLAVPVSAVKDYLVKKGGVLTPGDNFVALLEAGKGAQIAETFAPEIKSDISSDVLAELLDGEIIAEVSKIPGTARNAGYEVDRDALELP